MKKAILFASFGVINEQARKNCIDALMLLQSR